jgi:two-component system alkaline phosphatase synthesis response regulator PhoP
VDLLTADNRELQPPGTRPAAAMKVLIIDDDEDVRFVARMSLGRVAGMTVVEAARGQDGVALAKSEQPDFILLDMMMPDMDGAATLRALQAGEATASIPVVFLTARAMTSEVQRLKGLGVRGVVLKPFNPMTLASEITAILSG